MPQFTYIATDAAGRREEGRCHAASLAECLNQLRAAGLRVSDLRPFTQKSATASAIQAEGIPGWWRRLPVRSVDVEITLQQLAVMLRAGLTLLDAMETLIEQAPGRATQALWADVSQAVSGGMPLADALEAQPSFPHVVRQLVRVAEESGNLDVVLYRCAEMMERKRLLKTSTISAMAYPFITLLAAAAVTIYMVLGVIPQMRKFLMALGRKLPAMTQSLVDLSVFLQNYGLPILAGATVFAIAAVLFYLSPSGRMQVDTWILRLPIIGPVLRVGATALLARAMSLLLQSGVTLLEALRTVETLHGNRRLGKLLAAARNRIIDGESLAPTLSAKGAYTPMLAKMAAVGETSGSLDEVLEQVAIFHEAQLQAQIRRLSALVEPAVIILVGGIVGYVYIAFFIALFASAGATK